MTNALDTATFSIKLDLLRVSTKTELLKAYTSNAKTYVVLALKESVRFKGFFM
jgi:predicted peptidase